MKDRRARVLDDLRGFVRGELWFTPLERAPFRVDASLYEIDPLGAVSPRDLEDLRAVVRYAGETGLTLHARGCGTGLAGESLGEGLVIDFSRHLRRIRQVGPDQVIAQPGVTVEEINRALQPWARRLGPDPSAPETCSLGAMVAGNAAGAHSLRYGVTADHVRRLRILMSDGEEFELTRRPWPNPEATPVSPLDHLARKIALIVGHHRDQIVRLSPCGPRNRAGYALHRLINQPNLDLTQLIIGSEGTLALITEVEMGTVPRPQAASVVVLPFASLIEAASATIEVLDHRPSACELVDHRSLRVIQDHALVGESGLPQGAESVLIVAFHGDSEALVMAEADRLAERFARRRDITGSPFRTTRRPVVEQLLNLRGQIFPALLRRHGHARPIPLIEDVAVPPSSMPRVLNEIQRLLRDRHIPWTLYAHAGAGQLHLRPILDLGQPGVVDQLEPLAEDVYRIVLDAGGTISGEHGCGLVRSQFLALQYGDLYPAHQAIKEAFDPFDVLNPGKVIVHDPHLMRKNLQRFARPHPTSGPEDFSGTRAPTRIDPSGSDGQSDAETNVVVKPQLAWREGSLWDSVNACNGCGVCRTQSPQLRSCPSFRTLKRESASPKSQVQILRQIASGQLDPRLWGSEELRRYADVCLHCDLCDQECPSGVDVSRLMIEAKAAYVARHGLSQTEWMLSRVDLWAGLGMRMPRTANALLAHRGFRRVLESVFGLSRYRQVPTIRSTPFLTSARRRGLTTPKPDQTGPRVAYFVDTYANVFDPTLAETLVSLLQHAGIQVYVPPRQRGSGMSALVVGDLDRARELASINLRVLSDAVRRGYTIVCSEPTAALMIRKYYPDLTQDLDADLVADHTLELGQYLQGLDQRGQWPHPSEPVHAVVGYHQPCHLRALKVGRPSVDLLERIPGLRIQHLDRGCSGMAGTYGLSRANFRNSLRAGRPLRRRLRGAGLDLGTTECSACRLQMEQANPLRTLHPVKLLALAYGLDPHLREVIRTPKTARGRTLDS